MSWRKKSLIIVVYVLLTSSPCAAEPFEKTWGVGYDKHYSYMGGLTVRRWLGQSWELGLSAAPEDSRSETRTLYWGDGISQDEAIEDIPEDDTKESGWVRMLLGRSLLRHDDLDMMLDLGLKYWWSDAQRYYLNYYEHDEMTRIDINEEFEDRWTLSLELRPSYEIAARMTLETRFGLKYESRHKRVDGLERRIDAMGVEEERHLSTTEKQSFNSYGWSGLSSLSFIFWF